VGGYDAPPTIRSGLVFRLSVAFPRWHLTSISPQLLPFAENLPYPAIDYITLNPLGYPRELAQILFALVFPLVLQHLDKKLDLVNVVNKLRFFSHAVLILLPNFAYLLAIQTAVELTQQVRADVVHSVGLPPALLRLAHIIYWCDISDKGLGHVMDKGHATTFEYVEVVGNGFGGHHSENTHAVHVVGDGFALDAKSVPSCALGRLQALQEVEEGDG